MSRVTGIGLLASALVVGASGCSQRAQGNRRIVTDSVGVEVVRVQPPTDTADSTAVVVCRIGVASGSVESQLDDVGGALRLGDGTIVVANGGSGELRFFDATGAFVHAVGRRGEGPNEYQSMDYLGLRGDTIAVYDERLLRLSLLDLGGEFLRSVSFANLALPYVAGTLDSGAVGAWRFTGPEEQSIGIHTAPIQFGTITIAAGDFRVFGVASAAEEALVNYQGRVIRAFRAYAREGDVAAGGSYVYVLDASSDNRISVYAASGHLVRVLAIDVARRAPTAADVNAWVESWMNELHPPQKVEDWWRFGFRTIPPPDSIPLLRSLVVDSRGNVCAERYPQTLQSASHYWCFTPKGHFVRGIQLPPGAVRRGVHQFGDPKIQIAGDYVVGVWADDLGVERVEVFRLPQTSQPGEDNGA